MKPGDIIFVRGSSLISKIIRLIDKGEFSHVAVAVSESHVIEINWNMKSKIVPFYYEDFEIIDLHLLEIERIQVSRYAESLVGRWYDYRQILGYLLWRNGGFNSPRYLICSELVYMILREIDRLPEDEDLRNVTPNELYSILERRCDFEWNN